MQVGRLIVLVGAAVVIVGCGSGNPESASPPTATTDGPTATASPAFPSPPATARPSARASTRVSAGPPAAFGARIDKIRSRSTVKYSWHAGCPVPISGLRLITLTYRGFDERPHQGQLVVNATAAARIVKVFKRLYDSRYPIRRMELVDRYQGSDFDSIEADNTSAFNCRNATGSSSWSQHAYGLAVDINPCENPYVTAGGDVAHRHCVKYRDRSRRNPGVIHRGDKVTQAFASIGWGWGGSWNGTRDYQHFSASGR